MARKLIAPCCLRWPLYQGTQRTTLKHTLHSNTRMLWHLRWPTGQMTASHSKPASIDSVSICCVHRFYVNRFVLCPYIGHGWQRIWTALAEVLDGFRWRLTSACTPLHLPGEHAMPLAFRWRQEREADDVKKTDVPDASTAAATGRAP